MAAQELRDSGGRQQETRFIGETRTLQDGTRQVAVRAREEGSKIWLTVAPKSTDELDGISLPARPEPNLHE
jgi:hypothetical protein